MEEIVEYCGDCKYLESYGNKHYCTLWKKYVFYENYSCFYYEIKGLNDEL